MSDGPATTGHAEEAAAEQWGGVRWVIPAVLALIAVGAVRSAGSATTSCSDGSFLVEWDRAELLSRTWFPPTTTCRYWYGTDHVERVNGRWELAWPLAFLLAAVAAGWWVARHPTLQAALRPRPLGVMVARIACYWLVVAWTGGALLSALFADRALIGAAPILTVPLLAAWTVQFQWRATTHLWTGELRESRAR